MLPQNNVLILTENGFIEDIILEEDAGDGIQYFEGIISPGFINTHCHLELSHLCNKIKKQTGLINFVIDIVAKRAEKDEIILDAIQNAEETMLQNGIVAVGDICNTNYTIYQKKKNNLAYYNFIETSGWLPQIAQKKFNEALHLYDQFTQISNICSIIPHAPYSVSNELWSCIKQQFSNNIISIHNQETKAENELFLNGTGVFNLLYQHLNIAHHSFQPTKQNSLPSYFHQLQNAKHILLVHNTFTSQSDIQFLHQQPSFKNQQIFFCLCPNANLYIENVLPNINLFKENNIQLTIGTDSLASNSSLNILNEIKTIIKHNPKFKLTEILQWATLNGAKALSMSDKLGSLVKGKKPGVILIDNDLNFVKKLV
jgi:cytosine/adenosine deaminase-related metal-dependent hydrolase